MEMVKHGTTNLDGISPSFAYLTSLIALAGLVLSGCCRDGSCSSEPEYISIFDGETLDGWEGDPTYWRVENGSLFGEVTPETLLKRNSFIIWQGDMPPDFELLVEYRISDKGNSGINYRSEPIEGRPYALRGYQGDLDGANRYTGSNYEEQRRRTLASQGERTLIPALEDAGNLDKYAIRNRWTAAIVEESLGDPDALDNHVHNGDWNLYRIVAVGNHLRHYVNGVLMSEVLDEDPVNRRFDGMLGVQVHVGPPMTVEYRNFRIRELTGPDD